MQERNVTVKNIPVHYKVFGKGQPMLILHGWPSKSDRWSTVAEILATKGIMSVIPDLPGFGQTPEPTQALTMDNYVDWILEFTQKVPELRQDFYLLGHSFGGAVATKFAIKYNQQVEKLFLVSAACIREKTAGKTFFNRTSKVAKLFSFLPYYELLRKAFYKFIIRKSDYLYFSGVMKETYLKVISEDLSWRLPSIKVPTILIWGDEDTSTPIAQAHIIHEKIAYSTLVVIPGGVHALEIKTPEILAQKILEHIA